MRCDTGNAGRRRSARRYFEVPVNGWIDLIGSSFRINADQATFERDVGRPQVGATNDPLTRSACSFESRPAG